MQMIKKSRVYGLVVWLYISGFEGSVDAVGKLMVSCRIL